MKLNQDGPKSKNLSKGSLDLRAYEALKKEIITGQLAPNQSLIETEIAARLGISRTPLRTAIKMLEAGELVRVIAGKGAFVTDVSIQDISELFEYRILLECHALKNYVAYAPEKTIDEFIALFSDWQKKNKFFNEEYHSTDNRFHMDIIQYIENSRMFATYMRLHDQIDRFRHVAALDPSRLQDTAGEHLKILNAAKKRDFREAEEALTLHLENVKNSTRVAFSIYMRNSKLPDYYSA